MLPNRWTKTLDLKAEINKLRKEKNALILGNITTSRVKYKIWLTL